MDMITLLYIQIALLLIIAVEIGYVIIALRLGDPPPWPANAGIPPVNLEMKTATKSDLNPPNTIRAQIEWLSCLAIRMFRSLEAIEKKERK